MYFPTITPDWLIRAAIVLLAPATLVRGSVEEETVLPARRGEVADNLAGCIDVSRLRTEGGWRVDSSAFAFLIEKRMLRIIRKT